MLNSSIQLSKWSAACVRRCESATIRLASARSVRAGRLWQFAAIALLLLSLGPRPALSAPPGAFTFTATSGTNQVVLTWSASSGATGYQIYRSTTSGSEVLFHSTGMVTTYTNTGLTNGHTYYYEVDAVNSSGTTSSSSGELTATPIAAPSPTATGGNTQIILSWTAIAGATSYSVYRGTTSTGESTTPVAADVTTAGYTDNGLVNSATTTYYYYVVAFDATGTSLDSSEVHATATNSGSCSGPVVTVLHSFGVGSDGANPQSGVIQGAGGNFYGTTTGGGSHSDGTVYMMTPSGQITILYNFAGGTSDGAGPVGTLIQNSGGTLYYGVTTYGGANNDGTIFEIDTTTWAVAILHNFGAGSDGSNPYSGLVQDANNNLYGVTFHGGSGVGTIFEYDTTHSTYYSYPFTYTGSDGQYPVGDLVYYSSNLYGTTVLGGSTALGENSGDGTVFEATPPVYPSTTWAESILHSFGDGSVTNDGWNPYAGVIKGTDGNFYGTTQIVGANSAGTTFMIAQPVPPSTSWTETVLHSFTGSATDDDGKVPWGGLTQAMDGNFYGTTYYGGAATLGTLFEMTPYGEETVLHSFEGSGAADGANPYPTLTLLPNGEFYGTTPDGGTANEGTAFRLSVGMCAGSYLTATAGNSEVTLNWTASGGATSYSVYRATTSGGEGSTSSLNTGTATSFTDTDPSLTNGRTYFYTVNAVNALSTTPSNEVSATPSTVPSSAPTLLATSGIGQISLSWTASSGGTSYYNIYRATTSGAEGSTPVFSGIPVPATSYIDNTGSADYYEITSVNGSVESAKSNEVSATETLGASVLSVTSSAGAATVILAWTAGVGANTYNIYRGTSSGGESGTPIFSYISGTSYSDTSASSGGTYYYYIKGLNSGIASAASNEVEASPTAVPVAPTTGWSLTATAGAATVVLNWASISTATSYSVYRGTAPPSEGSTTSLVGITTTSYTDTGTGPGLTNGTTYYYTVAAVDAGGTSPMSNDVAVVPLASGSAYAPTGLLATPIDSTHIALKWTASTGATKYYVWRGTSTRGENTVFDSGGGGVTTYTDPVVAGTTTYYYTVKAVTSLGTSAASNEAAATPVDPTGQNDTSALPLDVQSLVDNAIYLHLPTVTLPAGIFRVTTSTVNIDNITSANRLTIQGQGSGSNQTTLLFSDIHERAFDILLSSNVTLTGFTMDYDPLPFTEGAVSYSATASATATAGSGQVVLSWSSMPGATSYNVYQSTTSCGMTGTPGTTSTNSYTDTASGTTKTLYYYTIYGVSSGGTSGVTELEITTPGTSGSTSSSSATMTVDTNYPAWSSDFNINHPMVFNETSPYDWETGVQNVYVSSTASGPDTTHQITLFSDANQNITSVSEGLAVGDLVALNDRSQYGIHIGSSSNTIVQGITINSAPGLALASTFASGENYFNYTVARGAKPSGAAYPRLLSSCADAFNYADARVGPVLNGCNFSRMGDDNVNIHGPFFNVSQIIDGSTLQVQDQAADLANYANTTTPYSPLLQAGDTARIMAEGNLAVLAKPAINYWESLPGLTATTNTSNNQVKLTWTASSGATGYCVYRGTASGGESLLTTTYVPVSLSAFNGTYTDTTASSGTYFYTVASTTSSSCSSSGPASNQAIAIAGGSSIPNSGGFTLSPASAPTLSLGAAGITNGSTVDLDTTSSTWSITSTTSTPQYLALNSGPYCLQADNNVSGSGVQIWSCSSTESNELWSLTSNGAYEQIELSTSGPCLDATGTTSGSSVNIATCNTSSGAQKWLEATPPRAYLVGFTSSLPSSVTFGDHFDDAAADAPGFLIANNTFGDNKGRGILDRSSNGLIENNTFHNITQPGIIVGPEFGTFMEAGWVTDVTVDHNTFSDIGTRSEVASPNSYMPGAISVSALLSSTPPVTEFSQEDSNITISNNTIEDGTLYGSGVAGIFVNAAQNVTISGNTISDLFGATGACSAGSLNDFGFLEPITVVNSTGLYDPGNTDSDGFGFCPGVLFLSAAGSGSEEINLTWTPSPGATSYNVYEGPSTGDESTTAIDTGLTTTSYLVSSGLTTGQTYYFTVTAVNGTGSAVSNEAYAVAP